VNRRVNLFGLVQLTLVADPKLLKLLLRGAGLRTLLDHHHKSFSGIGEIRLVSLGLDNGLVPEEAR
jgi:hypothetical protein